MSKKNNLKTIAVQTAIDHHFSKAPTAEVWDKMSDKTLSSRISTDQYIVWEPFENYDSNQLAEWVESLADNIEESVKHLLDEKNCK